MKWLKFWCKPAPTKHELSDKQREVLDFIDQSLVDLHKGVPVMGEMKVKLTGIPYMSTMLNVSAITKRIGLEQGQSYLPRSVALVVDQEGNWIFLYSVRESVGSDQVTTTLFVDALTRTNNAR